MCLIELAIGHAHGWVNDHHIFASFSKQISLVDTEQTQMRPCLIPKSVIRQRSEQVDNESVILVVLFFVIEHTLLVVLLNQCEMPFYEMRFPLGGRFRRRGRYRCMRLV